MNRLFVFAILMVAFAGSEAFMYNVTVTTGSNHFDQVNGSIQLFVSGNGCPETSFILASRQNLTYATSYTKSQNLDCNVQQINGVYLLFTKTNPFLYGHNEIIIKDIKLEPTYIQNAVFRQQETLTFRVPNSYNTVVKHGEKKFFYNCKGLAECGMFGLGRF